MMHAVLCLLYKYTPTAGQGKPGPVIAANLHNHLSSSRKHALMCHLELLGQALGRAAATHS